MNRVRLIKSILIGLFVGIAVVLLLSNRQINPTSLQVELKIRVLQNDKFYVYYLENDVAQWHDDYSVINRIQGSAKFQNIVFDLPIANGIKKIRIDIGANKNQEPIKIESIRLKSESGETIVKNDSIPQYFDLNQYAVFRDAQFEPRIVSDRYDPFMVSTEEIDQIIGQLLEPKKLFADDIIVFLAILFGSSFSVFSYTLKSKCSLDFGYVSFFVLIITSPTIVQFLELENIDNTLEKRELKKFPEFSSIEEWPRSFEDYYSDNFGLRNLTIEVSGKIKVNFFRTSPKPELVQFGKDHFLFYNSNEDEIFESYTHSNLFSDEELDSYYQRFLKRKQILAEKNIKYVVGFWPNKHSIYSDKLPTSMKSQIHGNYSLADQIIDYFGEKGMDFFDVREAIFQKKDDYHLYRKLDTHWNSTGAYFAYIEFCRQTFDELALQPFSMSDFEITYERSHSGDLTEQVGVGSILGYSENNPIYVLRRHELGYELIKPDQLPNGTVYSRNEKAMDSSKLLVFRDSFTSQLVQFLSLHYKEVIYINGIYDERLIDSLHPDIVISCRVERYMKTM